MNRYHRFQIYSWTNLIFVFTKGSSLLIYDFDYFKYRRMIGDIDILIDKNYLITAREILKKIITPIKLIMMI